MAKIYGLQGLMSGKLANSVMVIRNGMQVARAYNPVVANPRSPAQVEARAKLKLMSQLSTVMAPVIAMPRQGNVSTRNLFVKTNYGAATYSNNTANITLASVKLTKSVVSLPGITLNASGNTIEISLNSSAVGLSRVVYVIFKREADNTLRLVKSEVVSTPGAQGDFGCSFTPETGANYAIYAYGVRDNTETARVKFGEMEVPTAENVAKLIVTRQLTEADVTLTETRYNVLIG